MTATELAQEIEHSGEGWMFASTSEERALIVQALRAYTAPSENTLLDTYKAKVERDAATMKVLRLLLREAHGFLNAQAFEPEDYDDWEKRYKAFTESLDRTAAGVAFVTDTRLGGT